jgi:excisionase family DNA binding protein
MPAEDREHSGELTIQPLSVRIPDACRMTGIGRSKLYELIRDGRIRTIKVGAITLIPVCALADFLGIDRH